MNTSSQPSGPQGSNQQRILTALLEQGSASRAELSRKLHLSKPTVSDNVAPLLAAGVLQETEVPEGDGSRGRKPTLLRFCTNYRYVVVVDLSFQKPLLTLCGVGGGILSSRHADIPADADGRLRGACLLESAELLLRQNGIARSRLYAIGVSAPGTFTAETGPAYANSQFAVWYESTALSDLAEHFGVPMFFVNDADAAAIGEWTYTTGRTASSLLYISCGMGLGCGLILNRRLYEGSNGHTVEICGTTDREKYAGRRNLESDVSMAALEDRVRRDLGAGLASPAGMSAPSEVSFERIVRACAAGDPYITERITALSEEIGFTVANIVNLLGVETVVLGGEYLSLNPLFGSVITRVVQDVCPFPVTLQVSKLGQSAGTHGIISVANTRFIRDVCAEM